MQIAPLPAVPSGPAAPTAAAGSERPAREAAEAFEAAFLAEMLKYSGINAKPSGFGGGAGEEAFAGFLTEEYARLLAERGGIGIAERVFGLIEQGTREK